MPPDSDATRILISRTDSLGDVLLTLPLAGLIKKWRPDDHISFLGNKYTRPLLEHCSAIDRVVTLESLSIKTLQELEIDAFLHVFPRSNLAKLAKVAGVSQRIGTSHRIFHWWSCNKLLWFSRKRSDRHEAMLNLEFARPILGNAIVDAVEFDSLKELACFSPSQPIEKKQEETKRIFLHPLSQGSAANWPLAKYAELVQLEKDRLFELSGTLLEREVVEKQCPELLKAHNVVDRMGQMGLREYVAYVAERASIFIAASTGPLHIASLLGIPCIGLYPEQRPMHPGRWRPLGATLVLSSQINDHGELEISTDDVREGIETLLSKDPIR